MKISAAVVERVDRKENWSLKFEIDGGVVKEG